MCSDPSLTSATQLGEHAASSVVASSSHTLVEQSHFGQQQPHFGQQQPHLGHKQPHHFRDTPREQHMTQPRVTTMSRVERPDQPQAASENSLAVSSSSSDSVSKRNILWTFCGQTPPAKCPVPWCNIFFSTWVCKIRMKSLPTCSGVPMVPPTSLQQQRSTSGACPLPTCRVFLMVQPTSIQHASAWQCRKQVTPHLKRCADGATILSVSVGISLRPCANP